MSDRRQIRKGLSPETLRIISPEYKRESEERRQERRERREKMEWHLARAKRLRDSLKR
jgi:hypothetical protein